MFCFCDTRNATAEVLACYFTAGTATILKNHLTRASEKSLAWPQLKMVHCARNKMADTVEKQQDAIYAWCGSMDLVQRVGPCTRSKEVVHGPGVQVLSSPNESGIGLHGGRFKNLSAL